MIDLIRHKQEMIATTRRWQTVGESVCLVPTMGGIHDGHLALVKAARARADRVVVSIYVNPTQFTAGEDFDQYPRSFDSDMASIHAAGGCDMIYAPTTMYHDGHATSIVPGGVALAMEGESRPHFFTGVATVVSKLFTHVPADMAIFGEKDYQQLAVIRQLVRDLDLPIDILAHATIREEDGLALSSRNQYLSQQERRVAPALYAQMRQAANAIIGGTPALTALGAAADQLKSLGFGKIDYFDLRQPDDLTRTDKPVPENRIFAAVWLGKTRLIDNCPLA